MFENDSNNIVRKVLQFHNRALTNWLFHQVAFEGDRAQTCMSGCQNLEGADPHRTLGWMTLTAHPPLPNIVTERNECLKNTLWLTNDGQSTHI